MSSLLPKSVNIFDDTMREGLQIESPDIPVSEKLRLLDAVVLPAWIDYNGHMTDFRYMQVFSHAYDVFMRCIGLDAEYLAGGNSLYTAEARTLYISEVGCDERLYCTGQVLMYDEKRIQVFFRLHKSSDDSHVASCEALFLHVNTTLGRVSPMSGEMLDKVSALASEHAPLPYPDTAGMWHDWHSCPSAG